MVYPIKFQLSSAPDALCISIACKPAAAPIEPVILAPLTKFAALGAHGGLSGSQFDPATADVTVVSALILSATHAECRLIARKISPDAVHMLLGAIEFIDARIAEISNVVIECSPEMTKASAKPHSGHYSPVPFRLVDERTFQSRGYVVALEFISPTAEAVMTQVEYEAYGHWVSAANVGCFASAAFPARATGVYPSGDPNVSERTLVFALEEAEVTEPDATESLINVLQWVHRHLAPLDRVEFYE